MADVGLAIQRAEDKTEQMRARAAAVGELVDTGVLQDVTALPGETDLDREIRQLTAAQGVDDELARLKGEVGSGTTGALPAGEAGTGGTEARP
jgi:phage shock protein A